MGNSNPLCDVSPCPDGAVLNGTLPNGIILSDNICLCKAQELIQNWNTFFANSLKGIDPVTFKGFYIPMADLQSLNSISPPSSPPSTITGVRAYLALDLGVSPPSTYTLKLVLVPVLDAVPDQTPPIPGTDYWQDKLNNSLIFDFTSPCPPMCGNLNLLNQVQPNTTTNQ